MSNKEFSLNEMLTLASADTLGRRRRYSLNLAGLEAVRGADKSRHDPRSSPGKHRPAQTEESGPPGMDL